MPLKKQAGRGTIAGVIWPLSGGGFLALGLTLLLGLGACASAPDWADPGKLFDDDSPSESHRLDPDAPIPNLASVPNRPRPLSDRNTRDEIRDALAADLENAALFRQDEAVDAPEVQSAKKDPEDELGDTEIVAVIYFDPASAELGRADRLVLAAVAKLQRQRGSRLKVIGHASSGSAGSDAARLANQEMSEKRAEGVVVALISLGVEAEKLFYSGVGDSDLLYDESEPSGEAGNRRAEIFLETQTQAQ